MSKIALKSPRKLKLTTFQVKVAAATLMVIDHLGIIFDVWEFRILGRLSFPLFAWLLVQGEQKTSHWKRYDLRLLVMALVAQPLFLLFQGEPYQGNILFLFALVLPCLRATSQQNALESRLGIFPLLLWLAAAAFAEFAPIEYGAYGVAFIYLISSFPRLSPLWKVSDSLNYACWAGCFLLIHLLSFYSSPIQPIAGLFVLILPVFNSIESRGAKARWFYWFYPLHFVPLLLLRYAV